MGTVFEGAGDSLSMSNGGTAVFVEVLWLAVSELASRPWDFRFASLLALQDQNVMGRGMVGFDLEDVDWGDTPSERAEAKDFVLRVVDLALQRHRWDELGYEPPYAPEYLRHFRAMVEAFVPAPRPERTDGDPFPGFPGPDAAVTTCCVPHRVLNALPHWDGCVFCTAGSVFPRGTGSPGQSSESDDVSSSKNCVS
ncbi:hypothetical protein [Streptomyces sp. URMC 124]|uniref:hypothetical protein n=1 Tax=Streptomyces sp. URMC 124 TaxID=3423405 RepID=UPI003F1CD5E3